MTDIKSKLAAIRALCDEVEKAVPVKEEKAMVWNPRVLGQSYFCVTASGVVYEFIYSCTYADSDAIMDAISIGNAFPTREAAEKELKRRIVTQKLRELAGGFVPDWGNILQKKYFLVRDHINQRWIPNYVYTDFQVIGVVYFQHKETLEAAIATFGAELDVLL